MRQSTERTPENQSRRVRITEVDDSDEFMKITAVGLPGETFSFSIHKQSHGMTAHPTIGSVGTVMLMNGQPDQAILMSIENPQMRPKNRAEGEVTVYGPKGQTQDHDKDGNIIVKSPNGIVHINP